MIKAYKDFFIFPRWLKDEFVDGFFILLKALPALGIYHPAHRWDHRSRPETDQRPRARPTCAGTAIRRAADRQRSRWRPWPHWGEDLPMYIDFFLEAIQHLNFDGNLMAIVGL